MSEKLIFTREQKIRFALFINILFPLAGVSTDVYLPSLPAMTTYFFVSKAMLQLSVTAYVIAMGIGQLFAGPISDAFGRKNPMLFALLLQSVSSVLILFSQSIYWVLCFRFIQGIGAAFMMVPARAVINDIFSGNELKKQFGYSTISFALAPIVAPYIGGYLQAYFGWQANFVFILGYDLLVLVLLLSIFRETACYSKKLSLKSVHQNYKRILQNKVFLTGAILVSILMGYFALFSIQGPFLIQDTLGNTPIFYGKIALLMGLAWFLGNLFNRIFFRIGERERIYVALSCITIASLLFVYCSYEYPLNMFMLIIPVFAMILFSGFIFPVFIANSLMQFSELAASANACLFSLTWLFFGVYTMIGTLLKASSALPLSICYVLITGVSLLLYFLWV